MSPTHTPTPPWAKVYPDDLDWGMEPIEKPIYALLDEAADKNPNGVCTDFLDRHHTFADMRDLANRTARGLQQLGVRPGDRIGLCLPNTPYYLSAYFGALKAGAIVVNVNPIYTAEEIHDLIVDAEICVMFTLGLRQLYPKVAAALKDTPLRNIIVCSLSEALPTVKGLLFQTFKRSEIAETPRNLQNLPFEWLVRNHGNFESIPIDPTETVALLQYTGGTTGIPKGAMLTHSNIMSNTEQVCRWLPKDMRDQESILAVLPFFHVFAMTVVMCLGLRIRARQILLPRFDLDQVLKTIDHKKPTLFPAVPTIYGAINGHEHLERFDLTSIRYCISGGAPLAHDTKTSFEKLTGCVLVEGYGLSEASPVVCCNPPWGESKDGSIGIPLPGTRVEIRDLNHPAKAVADGERGEVVVCGPQVMKGYWHNDVATQEVLDGSCLHTGDIGHMDEEGYVFLTDRIKDVILSNGYNIYPRLIEEVFYKHPDVMEVVVIGIPHGYRGEAPKAFIRLSPGSKTTADDLQAFCADHLNPLERPDEIEFRDELPKTLIGKLSKKELIEEERAKRAQKETEGELRHG